MSNNDNLQTPEWVWKALGHVTLDPCAGPDTCIGEMNWNIDRGENGLVRNWSNCSFYCNPPFSRKEKWIEKVLASVPNCGSGILLLPERGSAPWFGPLAERCDAYWVMGKKINFIGGPSSNNVGSVMFLWGDAVKQIAYDSKLPGHLCRCERFVSR